MPDQPAKALSKEGADRLTVKRVFVAENPYVFRDPREAIFIRSQEDWLAFRRRAVIFLFFCYGLILSASFAIFFFDGFKFHGFSIPESILDRLAIATIGEVAGLGGIVYGALFKKLDG